MTTAKKSDKPNILFIMADDIGWFNVSCYNHGVMGYRTPNIDRIAQRRRDVHRLLRPAELHRRPRRLHHRAVADPHRSHQGRHAGRDARAQAPRIRRSAQFLKNFGYATGQFGKNHLGDRNEHLPTVHGFDEFFGNLYHLNAEEEPEYADYPKDPEFRKKFGPRGVLKCKATDKDDTTVDPAVRQGRQADDREHRPADAEADGDGRRGVPRLGARLHGAQDQGRRAVVLLLQPDAHARLHASEAVVRWARPGSASIRTAWSSSTATSASSSRSSTISASPTTRSSSSPPTTAPKNAVVAGWRRDSVPRREGHQLGRRLARAVRHALARRHRARPRHQRHLLAAGFHPDVRGGGGRARISSRR